MVSMGPRVSLGSVVTGTPWKAISPVKGFEPGQKKSAGMGS